MSENLNLSCGCVVYFFADSDQLSGADLCNIHTKIFNRMEQLSRGELDTPPPTLGISVSDGLETKDKVR